MRSVADLPPPLRLAAFTSGLVLVFAVALGVGAATGDVRLAAEPAAGAPAAGQHGGSAHGDGHGDGHGDLVEVGGTALDDGTYRLDVPVTTLTPGRTTAFTFRVLAADGTAVTDFDLEQERRMHLVLVDRDLRRFAHLHPEMSPDGTWTQPLAADPGAYRAVADFVVDGERHALGVDLTAPGPLTAAPLPAPATTAEVDGYRVALQREGDALSFDVTRDGRPVPLDPYLGSAGHLVALRAGDTAYAHVHPDGGSYAAALPPGTWRLFLQFVPSGADDTPRTASFTLEV